MLKTIQSAEFLFSSAEKPMSPVKPLLTVTKPATPNIQPMILSVAFDLPSHGLEEN
jgi:hypothetical protein